MDARTSISDPARRAGLPGKEAVRIFIAPVIPSCKAGMNGCLPVKKGGELLPPEGYLPMV